MCGTDNTLIDNGGKEIKSRIANTQIRYKDSQTHKKERQPLSMSDRLMIIMILIFEALILTLIIFKG